jgi:spore coat polysaccharide biosynthesis predicted glycosyltransferase SpsG
MSLQTPMITIVLAKNQEEIANQIAMEKAGINLSYIKDTDKNVIAEKIESIIISSEIRKNMAKNCKRLIPSIENNCDYFLQ